MVRWAPNITKKVLVVYTSLERHLLLSMCVRHDFLCISVQYCHIRYYVWYSAMLWVHVLATSVKLSASFLLLATLAPSSLQPVLKYQQSLHLARELTTQWPYTYAYPNQPITAVHSLSSTNQITAE